MITLTEISEYIAGICPIISINSSGVIEFDQSATTQQKAQAQSVIDDYVLGGYPPSVVSKNALSEKWDLLNNQWDSLTVTTTLGHTFSANQEAMRYIDFKANNMGDLVTFLWVEDWGTFSTNIVELKEALNLAADAHQALIQTIFGA